MTTAKRSTGAAAKLKSILVTHAAPADDSSPYFQLAKTWGIKVDFHNFIEIQGVPTPEFRKQNVSPLEYTGIILASKNATDHFFRICKDLRIEMPADVKYFCVSDATAKYLQKYITIRKRKLFVGERSMADLIPIVKKHASEKFLYPAGELGTNKNELTDYMQQSGYSLREAMVYQSAICDLRTLDISGYDMICFFAPGSVEALFKNFPDFTQDKKLVATFGKQTAKAATDAGLRVDLEVPKPETPSMTMAIEHYLRQP